MKSFNLAILTKENIEKLNINLIAAAVAYKERMNIPVKSVNIENEQPENLKSYFKERLKYYRSVSIKILRSNKAIYKKIIKDN